jgi:hypothetical protein
LNEIAETTERFDLDVTDESLLRVAENEVAGPQITKMHPCH